MLMLFFLLLIIALTRPRFGVKTEMVERRGVDIMIALDISSSMLAEDIVPNRLQRAQHAIAQFMDLVKGDRVGLIAFAGESFVQCPLTLDYGAARLFLNALNPDWIQLPGTAIDQAIDQATRAFKSKSKKSRVLLILSDGEDHQGDAIEAAKRAAAEGVRIFTIGIGSESGVPIPESKSGGNVVYKKDRQGNLVLTKLNPIELEKIALAGNGQYFNAGSAVDLSRIYGEIAKMEKQDLGQNRLSIYEERYQFFLFLAMLFLLVEFFIGDRVGKHEEWKGRFEQ